MNIEDTAKDENALLQKSQSCERGLHRIVVILDGSSQGVCAYCNREVEIDKRYLRVSTVKKPETYQLSEIYSRLEGTLKRCEEENAARKRKELGKEKRHR